MSKHFFIKNAPEKHNPEHTMVFHEIQVKSIISVGWVSLNNLRCAVAFESREQALKYLYSYIKPFVKSEDFKQMDIIEIDTTDIEFVNECLFEF
jgi:hypothetical protein